MLPPGLVALAALLLGLSAGASASAIDIAPAPHPTAPTLAVQWRTRLGKLPPMAWKPRATAAPQLTRDGRGVVFAGQHGVTMLRASDGVVIWRFKTSDAVEGKTVEGDGVIYAAAADGQVFALNLRTGRNQWPSTKLSAAVHAGVTLDARHLYVVADPGTVHAISRRTGKVVWRRAASTARDFLVEGHGAALVLGDLVLAGTANGHLLALSGRDGGVAWRATLGGRKSAYTDVDSTPVPLGQRLVVASSHNGGLIALSRVDGATVWHRKLPGARQPWVHGGRAAGQRVYVIAGDDAVYAFDAQGKRQWARRLPTRPSGAMAFAGQQLVIPTEGGLVLARRSDGLGLARFADGYGFAAAPLVVGNRIFAVSNAGVAYSLVLTP